MLFKGEKQRYTDPRFGGKHAETQVQDGPGVLLAQGQEIVATTKDARFQHKVEMVNLVLGGIPPSELSKYCSESKNTITLWVKTADEKGFGALADGAHPGRPPRLSRA